MKARAMKGKAKQVTRKAKKVVTGAMKKTGAVMKRPVMKVYLRERCKTLVKMFQHPRKKRETREHDNLETDIFAVCGKKK